MILEDLLYSGIPYIEDALIDICLIEDDLGSITSMSGRKVKRRSVVCVAANKFWSDREVQKYAEHEVDHYEYYIVSRKLYVYLKGDLEI